ncbi:hypothetical protein Tco_0340159 [Tanacetum coccineum]
MPEPSDDTYVFTMKIGNPALTSKINQALGSYAFHASLLEIVGFQVPGDDNNDDSWTFGYIQMENGINTYKVGFVINIIELGDDDPLSQNVMLISAQEKENGYALILFSFTIAGDGSCYNYLAWRSLSCCISDNSHKKKQILSIDIQPSRLRFATGGGDHKMTQAKMTKLTWEWKRFVQKSRAKFQKWSRVPEVHTKESADNTEPELMNTLINLPILNCRKAQ